MSCSAGCDLWCKWLFPCTLVIDGVSQGCPFWALHLWGRSMLALQIIGTKFSVSESYESTDKRHG